MNYPRYIIPGFTAAAFHAVLLFGFTPLPATRWVEIPLRPLVLPSFPPELTVPPPTPEADHPTEQIRPLRGDPAPPQLDDPPAGAKLAVFTLPPVERVTGPVPGDHLPVIIGDPTGDPHGQPHWLNPNRTIFSPDQLDRMPRAKVQVAPDYPVALRQSGAEGTVVVEFEVDAAGRVVTARVLRSTDREFEQATLRAVLRWRFEPGRRDGRPVPFRMSVPVDFRLNAG